VSNQATELAKQAKRLANQLSSSAYSQGVADERDSWKQQEKYDKQAREQMAELVATIDALLALVQPAVSEEAERKAFEAEAICRTWAYRNERGLWFYPMHDGGGDLWKGWLARAQSSSKGDEGMQHE